jgi:BirA family biotin operon repressor/biotin-[acetyl-CoA-carboxylase] ligase
MSRRAGETVQAVLTRLQAVPGFVSGGLLSADFRLSRMAISKAVAQLRLQGYMVESIPHRGYRLVRDTDQPRAAAVQPLLHTTALGRYWVFQPELASTNRIAAELAAAGAPQGLVVTAESQTQGRGRLGRTWHSPAGRNLYVSILLRPEVAVVRVPQISLVTALALRRALAEVCPRLPVAVKWPNDLWVGSRKLGGILCEMDAELDRVHHVVVGVGLNVNLTAEDLPGDLVGRATSVLLELGAPASRPRLLAAFLNAFEALLDEWLRGDDLTPFLGELEGCSVLAGRHIRVDLGRSTVAGLAVGVAPDGRLRLRTDNGNELLISSGDAHILRPGSP